MEKVANVRGRTGNAAVKKQETKEWNNEEAARKAGPDECYDPKNDTYVLKPGRRDEIKIRVTGITPEISENFLKKILKKIAEKEVTCAPAGVPVAVRFSVGFPYDGARSVFARDGYNYPSADLRAWSDFIYDGLQGVLYENRSQIVVSGEEVGYRYIPGVVISCMFLWDKPDRVENAPVIVSDTL